VGTIPDLRGPAITFVSSATFGDGYASRRSCGDETPPLRIAEVLVEVLDREPERVLRGPLW
jgi:hypothetical protein